MRSHSQSAASPVSYVRSGVVDPDVDPAELLARLGDQAFAGVAGREICLVDDRAGDLVRALC